MRESRLLVGILLIFAISQNGSGNSSSVVAQERPLSAAPQQGPLHQKISLEIKEMTLKDVLLSAARAGGVDITFDTLALDEAKLDLDRLQNVSIKDIELVSAVAQILMRQRRFSAIYQVQSHGNAILITTMKASKNRAKQKLPEWIHEFFDSPKLQLFIDKDGNVVSLTDYGMLNDEALAKFSGVSTLRGIRFEGAPQFTTNGLVHLSKLTNLERCSARFSSQSAHELGDAVIQAISANKTLNELVLSECGVTDEGLKPLQHLPNLTNLSIYQEGRLTDAALTTIAKLKQLKSLSLTSYVGTALGRMHFSKSATNQLVGLQELEHLDLCGHDFSPDILNFPHLKSLRINRMQFNDALAVAVANCEELTILDLSCSQVTDSSFQQLSRLRNLAQLNLRAEKISDKAIAHLQSLTSLTNVTLHTAELTDDSLKHLSQIGTLTKLDLNWAMNHFSQHGLEHLTKLPNLETLVLRIIPFSGGTGGLSFPGVQAEPKVVTTILPPESPFPLLSEADRKRVDVDLDSLALQMPLAKIVPQQDYLDHRK